MLLPRLYFFLVAAVAAYPLVVTHAHIAKVFVSSVAADAPAQRVASRTFVAAYGFFAQCCFQHFHALSQCLYFLRGICYALPGRPFRQQTQNCFEGIHV